MSTAEQLTDTFRANQAKRAAQVAALVALYYRTRVNIDDPASIERWLRLMIPRLMKEHDTAARLAVAYGNKVRSLELPGLKDSFEFVASVGANAEQIERSLRVVGPEAHLRKMADIRRQDLSPAAKTVLLADARKATVTKIGGAAARHVQNGARQTLYDGIQDDPIALGYVRVTKDKPCFFCAMLASRGLVYGEDSFDASDPRFTGSGNAKVHDSCGCNLKPVYSPEDEFLQRNAVFEALWYEYGSGSNPALRFRQAYEGREVTA